MTFLAGRDAFQEVENGAALRPRATIGLAVISRADDKMTQMSAGPGMRIGPFDVIGLLGEGGMGRVYRARDSRLNREVAIKVLPPGLAADPNRMARFSREAQVLAALSHSNIAAIFGLEESGGTTALVMELIEGQTLAERMAAGALPIDEALHIARQIANALDAAHEKNIVHRDLKPANIKIAPDGNVKVLDFGLAKALDSDPIQPGSPENSPTLSMESTRAGQILGTAGYMSPEQARGKTVDKRADIWAFGVVLYEMLTGRRLFDGETISDTLAGVLRAEIDLTRLPSDTPAAVRRVLERCLRRDPGQRLRDIADARLEIDSAGELAPVTAPVTRRAAWLPWALAVMLGGGLAWVLLRPRLAESGTVTRWGAERSISMIRLSRDGSRMAYIEGGPWGNGRLGVRSLDRLEGTSLPGTEGGLFPAFSPDNQWIAYTALDGKLRKVPAGGGPPIAICDCNAVHGVSWIDGDSLLFSSGDSLFRVPAAGGPPERLTTADAKSGETLHIYPQVLPGGKQAIFTIISGSNTERTRLGLLDLYGKSYRAIANGGAVNRYVPTGHLVYYRSGALFAVPFDLHRMAVTGNEVLAVNGVASFWGVPVPDYTFSDDGLMVYVTAGQRRGTALAWMDAKGAVQPITSEPQGWGTGRLSPDGRYVVDTLSTSTNETDVWALDTTRGSTTRLTWDGTAQSPIWSPDGRRVLYASAKGGKFGIYSVAADGRGAPELLSEGLAPRFPSSMTPDGRTLVYDQAMVSSPSRIMLYTVGSKPKQFHENQESAGEAQVSPDGKWVVYGLDELGREDVYLEPFPGGGSKVKLSAQGGGVMARWASNMREVYYWEGQPTARLMAVSVQLGPAVSVGSPRKIADQHTGTTWDPAPDGKRFLIEVPDPKAPSDGGRVVAVTNWFEELWRKAPAKK
jgi:serine/threonine-protein kinase